MKSNAEPVQNVQSSVRIVRNILIRPSTMSICRSAKTRLKQEELRENSPGLEANTIIFLSAMTAELALMTPWITIFC